MTTEEFKVVLEKHSKWLKGEDGGEKASLKGEYLGDLDLRDADLRDADLRKADLRKADLKGADLKWADLKGADLGEAYLKGEDLRGADLRGADLRRADLRDVFFGRSNLGFSDLRGADLRGADLKGADLRGADLGGADLRGADLRGAEIDFSCLPLWCGSLDAYFDDKQTIQMLYHACRAGLGSINTSDDVKNELSKIIDLANKFHRVDECGVLRFENGYLEVLKDESKLPNV